MKKFIIWAAVLILAGCSPVGKDCVAVCGNGEVRILDMSASDGRDIKEVWSWCKDDPSVSLPEGYDRYLHHIDDCKFVDGNTKTYIAGVENKSAGLNLVTAKDDTCVWVIDAAAKTIINKAISNRGLATQVASQYTNFSFYATSNFGTAEYQTSWFMAA